MGGAAMLLALAATGPASTPARAQIACDRATTPIDRTICATPDLMQRDRALVEAFRAASARGDAAALRQEQRGWLSRRARDCGSRRGAVLEACLRAAFDERIAALSPPAAAAAPAPAPAAAAPAPIPAVPRPPQRADAPAPAPGPLPATAAPAGRVERAEGPATGFDTLVVITSPGRFALAAEAATPVTLQLVDLLAGPGEISPGRVDAWLDRGTYQLRLRGDAGAPGPARLTLTPFAAQPAQRLLPGQTLATTLADRQTAEAWIVVPSRRRIRLEAAGRALADLQLWRDGRDLVPLAAMPSEIRAEPAHPLRRLLLTPVLEPGSYRLTAAGGPPLAWTDGAQETPLWLRLDGPAVLAEGAFSDRIGPFGSNVYRLDHAPSLLQVTLPEPAAFFAGLSVEGRLRQRLSLTEKSRSPVLTLRGGHAGEVPFELLVEGRPGQEFSVRGFGGPARLAAQAPGDFFLAAEAPAAGGDALPLQAVLLLRKSGEAERIIAGRAPQLDGRRAWRGRFNLSGSARLLFEVTEAGPIALTSQGVPVTARLTRFGAVAEGAGPLPPSPPWDLAPGWYGLQLTVGDSGGIADITLGRPDLPPPAPERQPPGPVLPFGRHTLAEGESFRLLANQSEVALLAAKLPLSDALLPLTLTQPAGEALRLPRPDGVAAWAGGVRLPAGEIAPVPEARQVTLSRPAAAVPLPPVAPQPEPDLPLLRPGAPLALDLKREQSREVALELAEGGLLRVESLGRLQLGARLGTAFLPELAEASANGPGGNVVIQRALRAGRYRLAVTAQDGEGRLRLQARPAPLLDAPTLSPGQVLRLALPAGQGARVPLRIDRAGPHRLELPSPGAPLAARLEDAAGWPLTAPGPADGLVLDLPAGEAMLVVEPPLAATPQPGRLVARLVPLAPPAAAIEGDGPHPLPFDRPQARQWRETADRTPDAWDFVLFGEADISLSLSEGMAGLLTARDGGPVLARIGDAAPFSGRLPAGAYRLAASAIGRNDRLDYRVSLDSPALQPGAPRCVTLPASLPLAIAEDRVVALQSFGAVPLRARLLDAEGRLVAQQAGDSRDWNLSFGAPLPAGPYSLELSSLAPPAEGDEEAGSEEAPEENLGPAAIPAGQVEVMLDLPEALPPRPLPAGASVTVEGAGVHRLTLPAAERPGLLLARAENPGGVALSLEAPDPARPGQWRALATARGTAPVLAVPAPGGAAWRLALWAETPGSATTLRVARQGPAPQAPDRVTLVAVEGFAGISLAAVALPDSLARRLPAGVSAGSAEGAALAPAGAEPIRPAGETLWLLAEGAAPPPFALPVENVGPDRALVLNLAAGETARLASPPNRFWIAEGSAPVALQAGRGMGLSGTSSVAMSDGKPLDLQFLDGGPARLSLRAIDLPAAAAEPFPATGLSLPPGSARRITLPPGSKRLRAELGAGVALLLEDGPVAWAGAAPLSRLAEGDWPTALLVNAGEADAAAALTLLPADATPLRVAPGAPFRRFFGTAGSLALTVEAQGQRLSVAGADILSISEASGRILSSADREKPLTGRHVVTLRHAPGPVLAWLDGAEGTLARRDAALPGLVALDAEAIALNLAPSTPVLLHAESSAPLVIAPPGGRPEIFAAGAAFHRFLPAGAAELRLFSPVPGAPGGQLSLSASPVRMLGEGLGEPLLVAPGGTALWGFSLERPARIGLGLRADPDKATLHLLDSAGKKIGEGLLQLVDLQPGTYLMEARLPPDAPPALLRPAILGLAPRPQGPPDDILRAYQALAAQP